MTTNKFLFLLQVKALTEKQFDTSYKKFEAKRYKARETEKGMDYIIEVSLVIFTITTRNLIVSSCSFHCS